MTRSQARYKDYSISAELGSLRDVSAVCEASALVVPQTQKQMKGVINYRVRVASRIQLKFLAPHSSSPHYSEPRRNSLQNDYSLHQGERTYQRDELRLGEENESFPKTRKRK